MTLVPGPSERTWCEPCQLPSRMRVPVHDGTPSGPMLGVLELCASCGGGTTAPHITITPPLPGVRRGPAVWLARKAHGLACRRNGVPALACAYGDCQWPGLWRREYAISGDEGTTRYVFCRRGHQQAWRAQLS